MTPRLKKSLTQGMLYFLVLAIIAMVSYGGVLQYGFWIDDWAYLWMANYTPRWLLNFWMHFGTSLEFVVFKNLFGNQPMIWMFLGIVLHVGAAYAVFLMTRALTRSKTAGIISGFFFSTFAVGVQATGWPNAYVVLMEAILLCLGVFGIIRYFESDKIGDAYLGFFCFVVALGLDFVRAVPIAIVVYLLSYLFEKKKARTGRKIVTWVFGAVVLLTPVIFIWVKPALPDATLYKAILRYHISPIFVYKSLQYLENLFGSLWNLVTGWLLRMPQDPGFGFYHRLFSRLTCSIVVVTLLTAMYQFIVRKSRSWYMIGFCVMWMILFYLPQWLFEPRITFYAAHRYMVIPSIGFIVLISWGISKIPRLTTQIALVVLFMIINIYTSRKFISDALVYRSNDINTTVMTAVEASVTQNNHKKVFIFFGQDPVKLNVLDFGIPHYALDMHITSQNQWPTVTTNIPMVQQQIRSGALQISDVYSWEVKNNGAVTDFSKIIRENVVQGL